MKKKLCDTCIYRNNVEQLKPCIIYRDDCEFYEKERGDMTLDEAIKHAEEVAESRCDECGREHNQLVLWLKELKEYREQEPKIGHCKDCKHFEYDSVAKVDGVPLIVAHEMCSRWGDGCKTREDGYCFLFEPRESEDKCKNCKYYHNPDYTRCHKCKAESEG